MEKNRKYLQNELLQFLKAPTYFCYCLALLLIYVHQYLPYVWANEAVPAAGADSYAFSLARCFGDCFGAFLVIFPVFVTATGVYRDQRTKKLKNIDIRSGQSAAAAVMGRFFVQVGLLFLPVLILAATAAVQITATDAAAAGNIRFSEQLRFFEISIVWLLPVIIAVTAVVQFLAELTGKCLPAILAQIVVWVFTTGSTAETGDYNSCLAIRHAVFGEYDAYAANTDMLVLNRIVVILISVALVAASVAVYARKSAGK